MPLTFGKVTARYVLAVADGADVDRTPDIVGATNVKPRFTPQIESFKRTDTTAFVDTSAVECSIDADGNLLDPQGAVGVWLLAGVYRVSFGPGKAAAFDVEVTDAYTDEAPLDLVLAAPFVPPPGAIVQAMSMPSGGTVGQVLLRGADGLAWGDAPSGTGGGAVDSVNGQSGAVVLDAADVGAQPVGSYATAAQGALADSAVQSADLSPYATSENLTSGLASKADVADGITPDERSRLSGVAPGATANAADSALRDRSTHTGTQPAATISDSTTVGRAVITAADATAARTAIGAGTSNLVIGTTSTTAKAGNYTPASASATAQGIVELATTAEATTGTDTARAVTPAGLKAVADTKAATTHTHAGLTFTPTARNNDAIQTALNAAAVSGGSVYLPGGADYVINGTITIPTAVRMYGDGPNSTRLVCASGALGITMLSISGGGDRVLENFRLTADGQKTAGEGIRATGAFRTHLRHLQIQKQYNAVEFEACTATWFSDTDIRDTTMNGVNWHATFDAGTNGNNAFELYMSRVLCDNPNVTNVGTGLTWGGGESFHVEHCNFQRFNVGFLVAPKEDQEARFGFIEAMLCDFSSDNNVKVAPEVNGKVVGVEFHNSWSGTATNYGVLIEGPGSGGIVQGVKWVGGKVFHNGLAGVRIAGGQDVTFHGTDIVGNSQTVANARHGVEVAGGVSEWAVLGCRIGGDFMQGTTQGWAISVDNGASDNYRIIGNDVRGNNNTPRINDGGTGSNKAVHSNLSEHDEPFALGSLDDTSDADKPISAATQDALDDKAAVVHSHTGYVATTTAGLTIDSGTTLPAPGQAGRIFIVIPT